MSSPASHGGPFRGTDRFELLAPLGAGAMCVVYRVRDRQHDEVVALKTLKYLDAQSLYRLKQEFRALSHLDHPNLVSFYELLHDAGDWTVTMELVEGEDFLSWVRGEVEGRRSRARTESSWKETTDRRFSHSAAAGREGGSPVTAAFEPDPTGDLPDVLRLRSALRQLAEGVGALHAAGRIHRDLKPSNVLVTDAGRVVILDFGLVAEIDQDYTEGTLHQQIAGSAAYMSPEQAVGVPLTEAADWYAVGVMLYEALTGVWPFSGNIYQILTLKQATDPRRPRELVPAVPEDLDELCMALLSRDPVARPTGPEVLARLRFRTPAGDGLRPSLSSDLVYRDAERARIQEAWEQAREGRLVVVPLRGASGHGKSLMLRELVKDVKRDGGRTLKTRCWEWERVPFRALDGLVDNLTRVLRRMKPEHLRELAREDLRALVTRFPVLERVDAIDPLPLEPGALDADEIDRRAITQLGVVLDRVARASPVLLAVDDAHHGDLESARALATLLAPRVSRLPILLVLTHPPGSPGPFVQWLVNSLRDAGATVEPVELDRLPPDASARLAARWLGVAEDDPRAAEAARAAAGSPGALRDRVRDVLVAEGRRAGATGELNEVVAAEIERLPSDPHRLLEVLAVAGGPVPAPAALAVAAPADAFSALAALRALQVVALTGTADDLLEIPIPGVVDLVLERLKEVNRRDLHVRLAEALELSGRVEPGVLVDHWAAGGRTARAATIAWTAGSEAADAGRWEEASRLLERAATLGSWTGRERASVHARFGDALVQLGRDREAADRYRAAAEAWPGAATRLQVQAAESLLRCGEVTDALAQIAPVLAAEELPGVPDARFASGLAVWRRLRQRNRGTEYRARRRVEVDAVTLAAVDATFVASVLLGRLDPTRGRAMMPVHLDLAMETGEPERAARALATGIDPSDAPATASRRLDEVRKAVGDGDVARAWVARIAGELALRVGDLPGAVEQSTQAEILFRRTSATGGSERALARCVSLRARLWQGELDEVRRQAEPLLAAARAGRDRVVETELLADVLPLIQIADGVAAEALDRLTVLREAWTSEPAPAALAKLDKASGILELALGRAEVAVDLLSGPAADPDAWLRAEARRFLVPAARRCGRERLATRTARAIAEEGRAVPRAWAASFERAHDAERRLREAGLGLELAARVAGHPLRALLVD